MKYINKFLFLSAIITCFIAGCDKVEDLPRYERGSAVTLSASSTSINPTAADSSNQVVTFSWTDPKYATDSALQKFVLEIDSTGRNFSHRVTKTVSGARNVSFTGRELNDILASFGFAPGQKFSFDIRVLSSYGNNNDLLNSNVIKVDISSYKVPINLAASSTAPIVLDVVNATNTAVSFNWNPSPYGANTIYYALQMDTVGGNFATPQIKQLGASLSTSFTVNELNSIAIAAGVIGGSSKNVAFRIASYLGNNYSSLLGYSDTVVINVTTFTPIPSTLYIVGDATPGGWSNPVTLPAQQFSRIDDVSYGIIINLTAGGSYLFLPVNGSWEHKYGGTSATGGTLLSDGAVPGSNTPGPAASGTYEIVVNFQTGTYTVTPVATVVPPNLYIVGDATPGSWANPVPTPSQQFTRLDAVSYGIVIDLTAGGSYLFLPLNGNWDHKFGGSSASGGTLLADGAVPGSNTPAPTVSGTYQIIVNFQTGKYTVTPYTGSVPLPQNLYIVGDATAGEWANPVPTPSQQFHRVNLTEFKLTIPLTAGKSYLFLPENGSWDHKFGGSSAAGGTLLVDGAVPGSNTPAPAESGTYDIHVNFATMKYTVTKQ